MQVVLAKPVFRALVSNAIVYISFTKRASVTNGTDAPDIKMRKNPKANQS